MDIAKQIYLLKYDKNLMNIENKEIRMLMNELKQKFERERENQIIEISAFQLSPANATVSFKASTNSLSKQRSFNEDDGDKKRTQKKIKSKLEALKREYETKKTECVELEAQNLLEISDIDKQVKKLKRDFYELSKQQRSYYMTILKAGIDVRMEGISWVVKRLMELRSKIDASFFPRYLDHSQVKYIVELASMEVKVNQKKILLTSIKNQQKINRLQKSEVPKTIKMDKKGAKSHTSNFFSPNGSKTDFYSTGFNTTDFDATKGTNNTIKETIRERTDGDYKFKSKLGLTNTVLSYETNIILDKIEMSMSEKNNTFTNRKIEENKISQLVDKIRMNYDDENEVIE